MAGVVALIVIGCLIYLLAYGIDAAIGAGSKLRPCKACKVKISKLAMTCPRCGHPQ